jgi:hypothetical protein
VIDAAHDHPDLAVLKEKIAGAPRGRRPGNRPSRAFEEAGPRLDGPPGRPGADRAEQEQKDGPGEGPR